MLWISRSLVAALAAFNVHTGHLGAAAPLAVGAAGFSGHRGVASASRSTSTSVPRRARGRCASTRSSPATRSWCSRSGADAAVTVHAGRRRRRAGSSAICCGPRADQVVYLEAARCARASTPSGSPNAHVRITLPPTLGIRRVELLGERITPLAALNDATNEDSGATRTRSSGRQGEEHCELLDLDKARLFPIVASVRVEELAAALVDCASR